MPAPTLSTRSFVVSPGATRIGVSRSVNGNERPLSMNDAEMAVSLCLALPALATLDTTDRGFSRFEELRDVDPLDSTLAAFQLAFGSRAGLQAVDSSPG